VDPIFGEDDERIQKIEKDKRKRLLDSLPRQLMNSIKTETGITFPRLPLTGQLGKFVKKSNPDVTDLYEGLAANKNALFQRDLLTYRSMLFATHGHLGSDLPGIQEPVLVLTLVDQPPGQDGFLRLTEIMGLKLNCDIAALTACKSGAGKHISGEGVMGIGRAFQYAGARSVLMSLWNVAETSSVMLIESFFKHLDAGKNKLEALNLARDEIRKQGYDHPYYWAPFILVGETE
jgi:CHAT domain-containing protein